MEVRGEHEDAARVEIRGDEVEELLTLGEVSLPAVVREEQDRGERDVVHQDLERGLGREEAPLQALELRPAEQRALGVGEDLLHALRVARQEQGSREREELGREHLRHDVLVLDERREEHVGRLGTVGRGGVAEALGAPELASVEEEELDVAAPAQAAFGAERAGGRAWAQRQILEERARARAEALRLHGLAVVVVAHLVVVPAGEGAGGCEQLLEVRIGAREPVHGAVLVQRDGVLTARQDARVGVDGVAEVDEEVGILGGRRGQHVEVETATAREPVVESPETTKRT